MIVPHVPSRFAQVKLERAVPRSHARTGGLFTIETSIELLIFAARAAPEREAGTRLEWRTEPGPEDLAGYRIERAGADGTWRTLVALTRETTYTDREGSLGVRYRLFGVNGLAEELLLGEAAWPPGRPLVAWPLPYRGGDLRVSFAVIAALGAASGSAEVGLYDVSGRLVRMLARGSFKETQPVIRWDGRNESGLEVPSGTYFLRSRSLSHDEQLKVVVIR
jgi:hypothetical protein